MYAKYLLTVVFCIFSPNLFAGINIQHWNTTNGARVYFVAAPELPMVDIEVIFDAGAARDGDKPGTALLTNGLLSEGAGKLNANQISERFDELGARFGNQSERDMAILTLRSMSDDKVLTPALDLFTTVLTQPKFPNNAFKRERKRLLVALEQRKQSPGDLAEQAFYKAVYGSHPYSIMPSGNEKSVKSLTIKDLKAFYQRYYVASNIVIAIVGDIDRQKAEQMANTMASPLPKGSPADPLPKVEPLTEAKLIKIQHPSTQTNILMGQPGVKRDDPDYFALYVGNHSLGGSGLVARLSDEIREKRGLAYSIYSYFFPMRELGPFQVGLQTRTNHAQQALKLTVETIKKFVADGPTEQELISSKKNITGGFPLRIASNSSILGYIGMIGFYSLPLDYLDTFNNKVEAVTTAEIRDAFKRRIEPDKMATILVGKQ